VIRQAEEARLEIGGDRVGIRWQWIPGGSFAGTSNWEKGCSEAKSVTITSSLFADDTTIVGEREELEEGVRIVKEVMGKFEERNNEDKEEALVFGDRDSEGIRMLGSWMGPEEDIRNRIRRANGLWAKVRGQLKGSRLSKRWQARIVEGCVESGLLFDSGVRVWWGKDIRKLQSWVDRKYRYVWSNRNGEPLRQMESRGENMWDVRSKLGIRSIRGKIEKRVLERIGHVLRMGNDRQVKAVVLGWYQGLEGLEKRKGKKRKTGLYWKRLLREAGVDYTDIERLVGDRDGWRKIVRDRVEHIEVWEKQQGHRYEWGNGEGKVDRNVVQDRGEVVEGFRCHWEGCGKVCKSKGGLVVHEKRMHRLAEDRVRFSCDRCGISLETEGARKNHMATCGGGRVVDENRRECHKCRKGITKGNYARHVRSCRGVWDPGGGEDNARQDRDGVVLEVARVFKNKRVICIFCRNEQSASNLARHQRGCGGREPEGGPRP